MAYSTESYGLLKCQNGQFHKKIVIQIISIFSHFFCCRKLLIKISYINAEALIILFYDHGSLGIILFIIWPEYGKYSICNAREINCRVISAELAHDHVFVDFCFPRMTLRKINAVQ